MNLIKTVLTLLACIFFVGCASTGKSFSEFNNSTESKAKPGASKAIVYRRQNAMG